MGGRHGLTPSPWPGKPRAGTVTLELPGRVSGRTRSGVVTWVELDGRRYLVSMLGGRADWVRNARAARSGTIRHRRRERVQLIEVPVEQRPPILKAYLQRTAIATRYHLGVDPNDPPGAFERIAEAHPVFQIVPDN